MNVLRHFRNGLLSGCHMSGTGNNNTPAPSAAGAAPGTAPGADQRALRSSGGEVQQLGGTMRVVAGQEPTDVTNAGAATADNGIDPATGLPRVAPPVDPNAPPVVPAAVEKTPAELLLEAEEAAKAPKPTFTPEQIEAQKVEAGKVDPRFVPFTEELMTTGDLSAASITKAATDFGVSEAIVKQYVEGQKAQLLVAGAQQTVDSTASQQAHDTMVSTVENAAGGKEAYVGFRDWANANLGAEDMETLTAAINGGNPAIAKTVTALYVEKYKAAGGAAPRDLTQNAQAAQGGGALTGFASGQEQSDYINSPKWRNDPQYRAIGEQRIALTKF